MLKPIDTDAVLRDCTASGRFPGEIHTGVAWWVGACLVVATKADRIAVARDRHTTSASFHRLLRRGAVNAEHYACRVMDLHVADEAELLAVMKELGQVPGALVTTDTTAESVARVRIALYDREGQPMCEESGLSKIRAMIAEDRVPIPVNEGAKGRVQRYNQSQGGGR